MVQICFFCCFHQPLMQAHRKMRECCGKPSRSSSNCISHSNISEKTQDCLLHHNTEPRGYRIPSFPPILLICHSALQLYSLEGIFTAIYCQVYSHLLTPESLLNPWAILDIVGHMQTETCPFRETPARDLILFSINASKNPWEKHFRPSLMSVSHQSKRPCRSLSLVLLQRQRPWLDFVKGSAMLWLFISSYHLWKTI